jgi:hypothetical protein
MASKKLLLTLLTIWRDVMIIILKKVASNYVSKLKNLLENVLKTLVGFCCKSFLD